MKKISSITLLTITLTASQAQTKDKNFGIRVGASYSNMIFSKKFTTAETTGTVSPKIGWLLGAVLHIPISKKLTLQPEYMISERRAEVVDSRRNYKLTYFSFPLFLQYKLTNRLAVLAGPQADLLVYSSRRTNGIELNMEHRTEERNINAVLGFDFKVINSVHLTVHYLKGLSDIGIESNKTEFKYEIVQISFAAGFK